MFTSSKSKVGIERPLRADQAFTFSLTRSVFNMRVGMLFLFLCDVLLAVLLYQSMDRPRLVAVIDSSTGKSYGALASPNLAFDILQRQLIYYSRQFCESYLGYDHISIKSDRVQAKALMHPTLLAPSLPKDFLNDASVEECLKSRASSSFEWTIKPRVTSAKDPKYTVFCQFTRIIKRYGFQDEQQTFNIKLDWGRLQHDQDVFNRPHSLTLLKFEVLQDNSAELSTQLNLTK